MRYYQYISDDKVDMFLGQIPGETKKKIAANLSFNIGLLSGSYKEERFNLNDRTKRLETVERYLTEQHAIGDIKSPQHFIQGETEATPFCLGENEEVTFFLCRSSETILLLGGSSKHLIGGEKKEAWASGLSFMPRLINALNRACENLDLNINSSRKEQGTEAPVGPSNDAKSAWVKSMEVLLDKYKTSPTQKVSFLAFRLFDDEVREKKFTLATPVFVSLSY